jgi:hypothetical protein
MNKVDDNPFFSLSQKKKFGADKEGILTMNISKNSILKNFNGTVPLENFYSTA